MLNTGSYLLWKPTASIGIINKGLPQCGLELGDDCPQQRRIDGAARQDCAAIAD
jgi:hypothetical protein